MIPPAAYGAFIIAVALFVASRTQERPKPMGTPPKDTGATTGGELARGLRNNNPGNIKKSGDAWRGTDHAATERESTFVVFTSPVWGIRAMARLLNGYYNRHGLETVRGIISRWAPAGSENPHHANYVAHVARAVGVSPDARLSIPSAYSRMIPAMIEFENGSNPYPPSLIQEGISLA